MFLQTAWFILSIILIRQYDTLILEFHPNIYFISSHILTSNLVWLSHFASESCIYFFLLDDNSFKINIFLLFSAHSKIKLFEIKVDYCSFVLFILRELNYFCYFRKSTLFDIWHFLQLRKTLYLMKIKIHRHGQSFLK